MQITWKGWLKQQCSISSYMGLYNRFGEPIQNGLTVILIIDVVCSVVYELNHSELLLN